jgi:GMP synthase-like glutamine amidotransferase
MRQIAIIENSEDLAKYFIKFLDYDEYEVFPVWYTSKLPEDDFYAYIFTGDYSNISDGLLPRHELQIQLVKKIHDKKIFGSCFFHQLIGLAYGGKVVKRKHRYLGWHETVFESRHEIFNRLKDPYFLNLNVDELIEIPEKAQVLATGLGCKYQILKYGKYILTCQSHPEIYKGEALDVINAHKKSLLVRCPDLEKIVSQTKKYANDDDCRRFMLNMMEWLRA